MKAREEAANRKRKHRRIFPTNEVHTQTCKPSHTYQHAQTHTHTHVARAYTHMHARPKTKATAAPRLAATRVVALPAA